MVDEIDELRAALAGIQGPARAMPLMRLASWLAGRYWRMGPDSADGHPLLDEAIALLDEAHPLLEPGAFLRGNAAGLLGVLRGVRHIFGRSRPDDLDTAVRLIEEGLGFPTQPPMTYAIEQLVLGQLLVLRAVQVDGLTEGQIGPDTAVNLDRAATVFRELVDGRPVSSQMTQQASAYLDMTLILQKLVAALAQATAAMQEVQQRMSNQPHIANAFIPNPFELGAIAAESPGPPVAASPPAAARTPAATIRAELPDSATILAMLADGAPPPGVELVDRMVSLGGVLVEAPDAVETDHLLLAVALHLRSLVDDGQGWGAEGIDSRAKDLSAAGDSLLASAPALVAAPADTVAVAVRLAALLDARLPSHDLNRRLAEHMIQ